MDRSISRIRQLFNERLNQASATMFYATVKKVDKKERTCEVEVDGVTFSEVLLTTTAEKVGALMVPTVDSSVLVSSIGGSNRYAVVMFSQLDKILVEFGDKVTAEITEKAFNYSNDQVNLKIEDNNVKLSAASITLNGDGKGGLVMVDELTTEINKLVTAFNAHTHVVTGTADPITNAIAGTAAPTVSQATILNATSYTNTKIKHGI